MVIEKYTQLRLAHQFGGINVIDIHKRYGSALCSTIVDVL